MGFLRTGKNTGALLRERRAWGEALHCALCSEGRQQRAVGSSGDGLGQLVKALVYLREEYFVRLEKQTSDLWDSVP